MVEYLVVTMAATTAAPKAAHWAATRVVQKAAVKGSTTAGRKAVQWAALTVVCSVVCLVVHLAA